MESWRIQLELLNEAERKSNGDNPIVFEHLDEVRAYNFQILCRKKCFEPTAKGFKGLSKTGKLYRDELANRLAKEQWEEEGREHVRRQTNASEEENAIAREALIEAKKANCRSCVANVIAVFALLVAIAAAIIVFCK